MGKKNTISLVLVTATVLFSQSLWADAEDRRQAKRIHDRLTGVPATNATINAMETRLISDPTGKTAAEYAIDTVLNPSTARYFYNVTLKNFAAPWTNEEQTVFTPLNDYTATVIGLVRDESDFRQVLHGNVIYRGNNGVVPGLNTPYRNNDNAHYVQLEGLGPVAGDLSDSSILISDSQSNVTGLPSTATAGVMTSRAGAMS
ncbi:MAG: hypothetical protein WBO58_12500, partial [Gammaproteobacteria bacterium]